MALLCSSPTELVLQVDLQRCCHSAVPFQIVAVAFVVAWTNLLEVQ